MTVRSILSRGTSQFPLGHPTYLRRIGRLLACALLFAVALPRSAAAANYYWDGTAATNNFWNFNSGGTNWSNSSSSISDPGTLPGNNNNANSDNVFFFAFPYTSGATTELGASTSISSLTFLSGQGNTPAATVDGGGTFSLTLGSGGLSDQSGNGVITLSADTILGASQTWTNVSANPVNVSGVLSGSSSNNLTFIGSGTFNLSNADTYSGSTTIGIGVGSGLIGSGLTTLTLSGNGSIQNTSALTINGGATLTLDNTGTNLADRVADTLGITSNGGTINLLGNSGAATTETLGTLTLGTGGTQINVTPGSGQSATLTLASLNRVAGSGVNFSTTGTIALTSSTLSNGILGPWATIGALDNSGLLDFATVSGVSVTAYSNYDTTVADLTTAGTAHSTSNIKLTSGAAVLAGSSTINTLYMSGTSGIQINAAGAFTNTLTIGAGGIIANGGTTNYSLGNNQAEITNATWIGGPGFSGGQSTSNVNLENQAGVIGVPSGVPDLVVTVGGTYNPITGLINGALQLNVHNILDTTTALGTKSATTTSGSTIVTLASGTTANLYPGVQVTGLPGTGISGTTQYVVNIIDSTHFTIGNVPTSNGSAATATFVGHTGLTKDGGGLLDIADGNANNKAASFSFQGDTTVNGGVLLVAADSNFGPAPLSFNPAAIILNGGEIRSTAGFSLSANRGITLGPQGGTISYVGGGTLTLTGKITGAGGLTFDADSYNGAVTYNVSNTVQDTYQGPTTIQVKNGSTFNITQANALPSDTALTLALAPNFQSGNGAAVTPVTGFGALDLTTTGGLTIGSLASAAAVTGANLTATVSTTLTIGGTSASPVTQNATFNGVLAGPSLNLVKNGGGTQILAGANTYGGNTTINAGTLLFGGTSTGTGQLTVGVANAADTGATLAGSGMIANNVLVNANGHLSPNNSAGGISTLTINHALNISGGAVLDYDFGAGNGGTSSFSPSDVIDVTTVNGNLTIPNNSEPIVLNITPLAGFGAGLYDLIDASGSTGSISIANPTNFTVNASNSNFFYYVLAPGQTQGTYTNPSGSKDLELLVVNNPNPQVTWTGNAGSGGNATWDTTSNNWTPGNYADGDRVVFDNNGTNTNISLGGSTFTPNSLTFSNGLSVPYTLSNGTITGAATTLTKNSAGTVTLDSTLNATYGGATQINSGTLRVNGSIGSASAVTVGGTVAGGAIGTPTLSGNGTIRGPVTVAGAGTGFVAGHLAPSGYVGSASPGQTLNLGGALTINGGSALDFNLNSSAASGNDLVSVAGVGAVNYGTGGVLNINAYNGNALGIGIYTLISDSSSTPPTGGTGWTVGANNDSNSASRFYQVGVLGQNLDLNVNQAITWGGQSGSGGTATWDTGITQNFFSGGVTSTTFATGNDVFFYDTQFGAGSGPAVQNSYITVAQGGVTPGFLSFNNNSVPYTIDTSGDTTNLGVTGGFASIILNGSSTVTLVGPNTYTGGTTMNAGTLIIGNTNSLGAANSSLTFNGGTLRYAPSSTNTDFSGRTVTIGSGGATIDLNGNNVTYANSIGKNGPGGLTLMDSGAAATLTLGGANTFGNAASDIATEVAILGGTLSISNGNNLGNVPSVLQPASVLINGGTLRITSGTNFGVATLSPNRGLTLGASGGTINIPVVATGTFNVSEVAVSYAGVISGASGGNLTFTGGIGANGGASPYLIELGGQNGYNGNTTINNATVSFLNGGNGGNGPANILPTTTVLTLQNNGWFVFNNGGSTQQLVGLVDSDGTGVIGSTNGTAVAGLTIAPPNGQTYTYNGVIEPVTLLGRTGSTTNTAFTLTIAGAGTGTEVLSNVNTYAGATTLNSGILQITNNNQIGSTTGTIAALTFNGGTLRYGTSSTNTDVSGRVVTFGANGGTIDLNGNTVSYANGIGNSGAGGPTLINSGAAASLTLAGASSYTGTTTVNSGTLIAAPTGTLGAGPLSIAASGTVTLQNLAQSVTTLGGAGQLNLSGNGGVGTALTVSNGASTNFSGVIQGSPGASLALSTGSLRVTGPANTYAGGTTINGTALAGGNLVISGNGTSLGTGIVNVGSFGSLTVGAVQGLNGTYYNVAPVNTANSNPNVASLSTLNTYFAGLTPTLTSNTTAAGANFDFTTTGASFPGQFATVGGTTPQNFQSVYRGFIYIAAAGTYTFGTNSDDGSVIYVNGGGSDPVTGVGTPTVNNNIYQGVNTTAGQPQVVGQYTFPAAGYYPIVTAFYQGTGNDGYQNFFAAGTTTAATTPVMSNSIVFSAGSTTQTIGGLTGSGAVNLLAGSGAGLLVGSGDATSNFAGSFTGTATESITKIGAGTLTLSGSSLSTFVSPIQVNAGTLRVSSSSATGNAPITVGGSAASGSPTLAGGGTIAGPVAISGTGGGNVAGHIAPSGFTGMTATALNLTGGLTLNTGSILDFNLSGSPDSAGGPSLMNDLVNVTGGAVDYGTGGILNIDAYNGSLAAGTYTLISSSTTPLNGTGWMIGTNNDAGIATHHDTIAVVGNNLDLIVTSATLNWTGANSSWDTSNKASWVDANGSATIYSNGVPVVFADTFPPSNTPVASTGGNVQVTVQSAGVTPGSVTFTNSTLNYIVSDMNPTDTVGIGGSTSISLQGTGTVTFMSANSFTGTVGIAAGQLNIQNSNALGSSSGVSVASGAALQLQGGIAVASVPLTIAGAGLSGNANGALQSVSGANSYGGPIMIGNGGATVTSSSASGGDGLTLTGGINNNGNLLTFAGAGNTAVNSVGISGAGGGLTLSGPGTLTLSATNGYTGPTNVNGGTLRLTGSLASGSAVTIGGASASGTPTLVGNGTINGSLEIFGLGGVAGHLAPSGFTGTSATTLNVGGSLTLDGGSVLDFNMSSSPDGLGTPNMSNDLIAVGGNLSLLGQGTLNINATNGGLGVGTYQLVDYSGTLFGDATQWSIGTGGQPQYNYQFVTTTTGQFDLSVSLKSGSAAWSGNSPGSDGFYGNSANWTPATVPNGPGQIATFGSGSKTTISLSGNSYTIGQLDFDNTGNSNPNAVYTISSGGSLVLDNSLNSPAGAAVNVSAGLTPNINTTLMLADSTQSTMFNIGSGATLNVSGSINDSMAVTGQQITLTGGGTLELDGVNAYTGGTTVTNGTLTVGENNPAATVGSGPLAIGAAGIVNVDSSSLAIGGLSGAVGSQLNVADSTTLSVNQTGTGTFRGALALGGSSGLSVSSGTLALNVTKSTQGGGATATVASGATLQLTGSVSALSNSDGSNPANVVTRGTFPFSATDGALSVVGTTSQTVGAITGDNATNSDGAAVYAGSTTVGDGTNVANLTATQILQNTLTINANSTVTIAPSAGAGGGVVTAASTASAASAASATSAESSGDSGSDPFAAIQAAITAGSISSSTGQRLENRIAAIERLAATDPGLDVSLLESRVLAALPSPSILPSTEASPLADTGSGLLAVDSSAIDSGSSGASAAFAAGASFSGSPAAVPEPSTLLLAALGGIGLAFAARRRVRGRNC
jgi:autotransporter-associated beta strand protein